MIFKNLFKKNCIIYYSYSYCSVLLGFFFRKQFSIIFCLIKIAKKTFYIVNVFRVLQLKRPGFLSLLIRFFSFLFSIMIFSHSLSNRIQHSSLVVVDYFPLDVKQSVTNQSHIQWIFDEVYFISFERKYIFLKEDGWSYYVKHIIITLRFSFLSIYL